METSRTGTEDHLTKDMLPGTPEMTRGGTMRSPSMLKRMVESHSLMLRLVEPTEDHMRREGTQGGSREVTEGNQREESSILTELQGGSSTI